MFLAPHPPMKPHLEAIDIQDGDGQRVLLWGHQCVDPGNEPSKQQCVQDLGDGIPGAEGCWGGWAPWGVKHQRLRPEGVQPYLASTALSTVRGVKIFSRIVSWGRMWPLSDSRLATTSRKSPEDWGSGEGSWCDRS